MQAVCRLSTQIAVSAPGLPALSGAKQRCQRRHTSFKRPHNLRPSKPHHACMASTVILGSPAAAPNAQLGAARSHDDADNGRFALLNSLTHARSSSFCLFERILTAGCIAATCNPCLSLQRQATIGRARAPRATLVPSFWTPPPRSPCKLRTPAEATPRGTNEMPSPMECGGAADSVGALPERMPSAPNGAASALHPRLRTRQETNSFIFPLLIAISGKSRARVTFNTFFRARRRCTAPRRPCDLTSLVQAMRK